MKSNLMSATFGIEESRPVGAWCLVCRVPQGSASLRPGLSNLAHFGAGILDRRAKAGYKIKAPAANRRPVQAEPTASPGPRQHRPGGDNPVRGAEGIDPFRCLRVTQRVKQRGHEGADVDRVVDRLAGQIVAAAVHLSAAHASAG